MKKRLLVLAACLCAASSAWGMNQEEIKIDEEKKEEKKVEKKEQKIYRLQFGEQSVDVPSVDMSEAALDLASGLKGFVEEQESQTINVKGFLEGGKIVFDDFKLFVQLAQAQLDVKKVASEKLVSLIKIANYVGALGGKDFYPKRELLKELCGELASRITDKDWDEYIKSKKGIFANIKELPDDVFRYQLSPYLTLIIKKPQELWNESISDKGVLSCVVSNGMIATAKFTGKDGNFDVAQAVVISDPLKKEKTITLKGKFLFNDREVFNVLLLPNNQIAVITLDYIQVFDKATENTVSSVAKPIDEKNRDIHSAPNHGENYKTPSGYLSQNCAVVFDDGTIVCTSDAGLFVWKVGDKQGSTIKVELSNYYPEGNAYTIYGKVVSLPYLSKPGLNCITDLVLLADNCVGIVLNEIGVQIYDVKQRTLKCSMEIEYVDNRNNTGLPSFSLLAISPSHIFYISNELRCVYCCDVFLNNCRSNLCRNDFFPEKSQKLKRGIEGILIRDMVLLGENVFAMNTTEYNTSDKRLTGDFVKIGKSLRDCISIPVEIIKYQRFGDYRLFNVGSGRIMLEQHNREKQKIHRKMWHVVVPTEGMSFEQALFVRAFMTMPKKQREQQKKMIFKDTSEKKKGSVFDSWSKNEEESLLDKAFEEVMNVPMTSFEVLFEDPLLLESFGTCLTNDNKNNDAFIKQLGLTEQETKALKLGNAINKLLKSQKLAKVEKGAEKVSAALDQLKKQKISQDVVTQLEKRLKMLEEHQLTLMVEHKNEKNQVEEEGEESDID